MAAGWPDIFVGNCLSPRESPLARNIMKEVKILCLEHLQASKYN